MRVLYLEGDPNAPRYVSGTLSVMGVAHTLVTPGGVLPRELSSYQAVVISDFGTRDLGALGRLIAQGVRADGLGLLMIGGWKSFGRGGYASTELGELLPVQIEHGDDREPCPAGMLVEPAGNHPILRGLPLELPVVICGRNRVTARPRSTTVLCGRALTSTPTGVQCSHERAPLLVVREAVGTGGRTAAYAGDLAPHWSGGLTDWGNRFLPLEGDDEVGDGYATLVMNLVRWVAGEDTVRRTLPELEQMLEIGAAFETSTTYRARG